MDLYRVTGEQRFLDFSRRAVETLVATEKPDGALPGGYGNTGDIPAAALARFALTFPMTRAPRPSRRG